MSAFLKSQEKYGKQRITTVLAINIIDNQILICDIGQEGLHPLS